MPFLIPLIPAIVGGVAGIIGAHKSQARQDKGQDLQNQIAEQQMKDKQASFDKLMPFFSEYLKEGSPFLQMIQRASAEQHATQGNNAAGQVRETMQSSGTGYGPSGTTAAAIGGVASENAKSSSSDYLTNLLNNEQIKFKAAQGIHDAGAMAGSSQNQPSVSTQIPAQSTASSVGAFGSILSGLLKTIQGNSGGGSSAAPSNNSGFYSGANTPIMPGPSATSGYGNGTISF